MTSSHLPPCPNCGSRSFVDDRIVEHDCGHVASFEAFADGCEKCGREVESGELTALQTVDRCLDCGHRSSLPREAGSIGPLPAVSFPSLPTGEDQLSWVPARFVPESKLARQLFSSGLVLLVLVAGIAGAVSVTPLLEGGASEPEAVETAWQEYDSIVVFRNDDVQAWYNQDELRAVNQVFIDEEVPVSLGIIPSTNGEAPLSDDPELCPYLRSLEADYPGQFEMALHGYTHEPVTEFYDGSEFGDLSYEDQRERLAAGEELLADCVDSPSSTFIPPMNTYDETTVEVLAEANYTTVSGGQWFTDGYYEDANATVFETDGITHVSETQAFEDWSAYEESEADDVPFHDLETLTASFDASHDDGGIHVIMIHYQYFTTDERLAQLESVIRHAKAEESVGFMTIEQLSVGLETGAIEETDDGWRVAEPIAEATR